MGSAFHSSVCYRILFAATSTDNKILHGRPNRPNQDSDPGSPFLWSQRVPYFP
jgi:hypothetical protein